MDKVCRRCGVKKSVKKFKMDNRQSDGRTVTCKECYKNNKLEKPIRTSEQIESQRKKLIGRKYSLEHRIAISIGQKRAVKEGNHHWKVNEYEHKDAERTHLQYKIWKEKLYEIKGKKCWRCGSEKRLHGHHIQCFYKHPELRFDVNNGELLCISCHVKHHRNLEKLEKRGIYSNQQRN